MIITLKKKKNLKEWHNWFAWFPVKTINTEIVWLTTVQQRVTGYEPMYGSPYWEYRVIESNDYYSNNDK
jgi:hypothetical protein